MEVIMNIKSAKRMREISNKMKESVMTLKNLNIY